MRYILVVPDARCSSGARPVLVFLHGYDEGEPMEIQEALTRHGPLGAGNAVRALEEFIVVAPQMPVRGDVWYRYAESVLAILRDIHERHRGDSKRSYLTGFSFGGNAVFDLALLQPETWAALWAVDPTRVPARDPQRPIWLSFGEVARQRKNGFIGALELRPAVEISDRDRLYSDDGADHVGSARSAYRDQRIYSWLLSKRLDSVAASPAK